MSRPGIRLLLALVALGVGGLAAPPPGWATGQPVAAVELVSPHRLPEALVGAAVEGLVGRPLSRAAVREAVARVWALGLFSAVSVEAAPDPGGVRLRFHLPRRPHLVRLDWQGDPGLDPAELVEAAALSLGGDAEAERLEAARQRILTRYREAGYLAAQVTLTAQAEPDTNGREVAVRLQAGRPARIGRLELSGVEGAVAALVGRRLALESGDRYGQAEVRDRLRELEEALHGEGYLQARVRLAETVPDPAAGLVHLAVEIVPGEPYRFEFAGRAALAESALRKRVALAGALEVDEIELEAAARQLEAAYREAGYPFVRVTGALAAEGEPRTIRFAIEEGPATRVERIDLVGSPGFPARRLRELMATRPAGLLEAGRFRQDLLDGDLRLLLAFYRSEGYPEATVGPAAVEFTADRTGARITIPVGAGPRILVGGIRADGTGALAEAELLAALPLRPGDPWSLQRGEEARRAAERLYARRGYLAAGVELETVRRGDRMDLALRVQEGAPTRIGRILVGGLLLTEERVVRRELPFAPGEPFDPAALRDAERRLSELGLFERVEVGPPRPAPSPFADVDVTLREAKPWHLDLGAGYGTDERWRGFLEVGHDNLFGTGRSATIRETLASRGDRTDLTYRSRRFFDTPWQAEVTASREQWEEVGYHRGRIGGTAGIQRPLFPARLQGLRGFLTYRLDWLRRTDVDPALAAADVVAGSRLLASLTPSLLLDRRDDPRDPSRGSSHFLALEVGAPALGGEVNFVKFQLETNWYLDWLAPTVIALSGRLGLAAPYGDTPALDIDDRFKAGGSNSVRGYPEGRVGPLDVSGNPTGGNGRIVLNAEWRFPLWRKWLGGVLFVDTGTVTPEVDDLRRASFKTGLGAGLRVRTPIGPLRIDLGYGLNPLPTQEGRWQLYFSIGHAF